MGDYAEYPRSRQGNATLWQEIDRRGHWDIIKSEREWVSRESFLFTRGYQLRPRYREGWKPAWRGTDIDPFRVEESHDELGFPLIYRTLLYPRTFVTIAQREQCR